MASAWSNWVDGGSELWSSWTAETVAPEAAKEAARAEAPRRQGPVREHGLQNHTGSNHCFLNVVIQSFWHLRSFRDRFLAAPEHLHAPREAQAPGCGHKLAEFITEWDGWGCNGCKKTWRRGSMLYGCRSCNFDLCPVCASSLRDVDRRTKMQVPLSAADLAMGSCRRGCCFCALKAVFTQYRFSDASTLPPDALRQALSCVYIRDGRFKPGDMEDATETIEALLDVLHADSVQDLAGYSPSVSSISRSSRRVYEAASLACQPPCIAHQVFGLDYVDVPKCKFCKATGEPIISASFFYTVYVAELLALQVQLKEAAEGGNMFGTDVARPALQELLRRLCQKDTGEKCAECNSLRTSCLERWVTRIPKVFVLSLVWPGSSPTREALWSFLSSITAQMSMDEVFQSEKPAPAAHNVFHGANSASPSVDAHLFRGMVCYYGMHYIAIFWCWQRMCWFLFDDTTVREEPDWSSVANLLAAGLYVPTLLFYEQASECGRAAADQDRVQRFLTQMLEMGDSQSSCTVS